MLKHQLSEQENNVLRYIGKDDNSGKDETIGRNGDVWLATGG
ncbi:MAG: hypothetical protein ACOY3E_01780 [Pseudomonadota bacterium]